MIIWKRLSFFLLLLVLLVISACATANKTTAKKQYDVGMQLLQAQKHEEAIDYFKQAIENEPGNKLYQDKYVETKDYLIKFYVDKGSKPLVKKDKMTIRDLNLAKSFLEKAINVDPSHSITSNFKKTVQASESKFHAEINTLYARSKEYHQAKQWLKSYFFLQQLQTRYPNYEDSPQILITVKDVGSQEFYSKAKLQMEMEDVKGAIENLRNALSLNFDFKDARNLMEVARSRDNKEYFVNKAKAAISQKNWDQSIKYYQSALTYTKGDTGLRDTIARVKDRAMHYYSQSAKEKAESGRLYIAFENYNSAIKYTGKRLNPALGNLRSNLCKRSEKAAENFADTGAYGSAWYWYKKIESINKNHPKIFHRIQNMEDEIKQRVRKSIAVFDFSSPTGSDDAGVIIANNLITFLFKTASGDIQILERENLKSILEEMKLGQIGIVSANSAKEMGRVYGIDVAIMGSVLLFKVDSTVAEGTKTVKYQIGTKIEDNIDYLNWLAKHPRPKRKELQEAPPAKIIIPEYVEKDYKVSRHKKIAFVQLSFRIVDIATGENIQVKTIERTESIQDEGSAGLAEANVQFDPIEIPSDTEMLQKITEDVVAELGREALRPLQNLEKTYFQDGEKYFRRKEPILSAENFVNALFDEKLKRIQDSLLTQQSKLYLDKIFSDRKLKFED